MRLILLFWVSRFDQSSPNVSQPSGQTPYSQHSQMPMMMQSGSDHGPQGSHGPGPQGPPGYMGGSQGRYPAQMPNQPMEQYGQQNYPGNQPGYGPKPMMNQEQYPGYQAPGYGPKQQMAMGYNTPNKNFPSRTDPYMSPGELNSLQIGHLSPKRIADISFQILTGIPLECQTVWIQIRSKISEIFSSPLLEQ